MYRLMFPLLFAATVTSASADERAMFAPGIKPPWEGTPVVFDEAQAEALWRQLSLGYFGERPIVEGDHRIGIEAPSRAEDDARVPITISTDFAEPLKSVYLVVDVNPIPMGAVFSFTEQRPVKNIFTRVRVNGFTYVRAIAETMDGDLYMDKKLVKSRGAACAAPPVTDPETAQRNLGKMRFRHISTADAEQSDVIDLLISHPNATGLQKDQVSLLYIPAHYVKEVTVTFKDELLMRAETSYTMSENPSFRFTFDPDERGQLEARMVDTRNREYVITSPIDSRPH